MATSADGQVWTPRPTGCRNDLRSAIYADDRFTAVGNNETILQSGSTSLTPVITWPPPAAIVYGTPLGNAQLDATADTTGSFSYSPASGTVLNAGAGQVLTVTFRPYDTNRFAVATASQTINVERAPLTIRADDKSRLQGQTNPPLTATYTGFVNGDSPASLDTPVTLFTTAGLTNGPGAYPILVSGASDPNYAITLVNGTLTILPIPPALQITTPPFSQTRLPGQGVTWSVTASGTVPFNYQWRYNGSPMAGATGRILSLSSVGPAHDGFYSVVVANSSGSATSTPARLTVLTAPSGPGSLDVTFDPTAGTQLVGPAYGKSTVECVAWQADGRLLMGGSFVGVNGRSRNHLACLLPTGALDESFNPGYGTDGMVQDLVVQGDRRILAVGPFTVFNGTPCSGLVRLDPDGTIDPTFTAPLLEPYTGLPSCATVQPDGKILVGGGFREANGQARVSLVRLHTNGVVDLSFNANGVMTNSSPQIEAVLVQPDGRILIAGHFGSATYTLARLNSDGSADASFQRPSIEYSVNLGWTFSLALDANSHILIAGHFLKVNGANRCGLARLNPNGSLDAAFDAGAMEGESPFVRRVAVQPDGKIVAGGMFRSVAGQALNGLARLLPSGAVDTSFDPQNTV
ncbi:MAG: MBG domain-containing protein, partial [Verrucomicrobia bacterium]|nr:MBG domain-containing protein [Verrucomicrobiota bacterium]